MQPSAVERPGTVADPAVSAAVGRAVATNLARVVLDAEAAIRLATAATLTGGHLLLEDRPGVGKTMLAKALAASVGGVFARIQGTADLLPSDITGVAVFDPGDRAWTFRPGPVFAHVVLVDEVNRATPRAQSALLEAMAERQVTVDGRSHRLPDPFCVIATQNPADDAGTFPLGAGQRDRFTAVVSLGLPERAVERVLLSGAGGEASLAELTAVTSPDELVVARAGLAGVRASDAILDYVLDIVTATRREPTHGGGASPRAGLTLLRVARALAVLDGRDYVLPDDVKTAAPAVLGHRVGADGSGRVGADLGRGRAQVDELLRAIPVPSP